MKLILCILAALALAGAPSHAQSLTQGPVSIRIVPVPVTSGGLQGAGYQVFIATKSPLIDAFRVTMVYLPEGATDPLIQTWYVSNGPCVSFSPTVGVFPAGSFGWIFGPMALFRTGPATVLTVTVEELARPAVFTADQATLRNY